MRAAILRRVALGAAVVVLTSVSVTAASAGVNDVQNSGGDVVDVYYTLDETDSLSQGRPDSAEPCDELVSGSFRYTEATLTVSHSGDYGFFDLLSEDRVEDDGFAAVYAGSAPDPLDATCVGSANDDRDIRLVAGTQYTLVLTSEGPVEEGDFGFRISGVDFDLPSEITVEPGAPEPEGVSFGKAQAACEPGGEIPEGYELREGTSRNDTVRGTSGNDVLRGLGGNDTLVGLGGDDILCGGAGNDSLQGGQGEDFLFGGAGNDDLAGGADDDVLSGASGNDLLDGGAGSDVGLDTQGNNTFRSIESRTLEPTPDPDPSPSPTIFTAR